MFFLARHVQDELSQVKKIVVTKSREIILIKAGEKLKVVYYFTGMLLIYHMKLHISHSLLRLPGLHDLQAASLLRLPGAA